MQWQSQNRPRDPLSQPFQYMNEETEAPAKQLDQDIMAV